MPVRATMSSRVYKRISVSPANMEELAKKFDVSQKTIRLALRYDCIGKLDPNERYENIRRDALENFYGAYVDDIAVSWQEYPQ